jgi:hypothetical protein
MDSSTRMDRASLSFAPVLVQVVSVKLGDCRYCDSRQDWNPRLTCRRWIDHRIGQETCAGISIRLEGTVEEKIIERAPPQALSRYCCYPGTTHAEQNNKLDKGDLMQMVRFGADPEQERWNVYRYV